MSDGIDRAELDKFFDAQQIDLEQGLADASANINWSDERTIWDAINETLPAGIPREVPKDVQEHFKKAQSEFLKGFKSLLDAWIKDLEPDQKPQPPGQRVTVRSEPRTGRTTESTLDPREFRRRFGIDK